MAAEPQNPGTRWKGVVVVVVIFMAAAAFLAGLFALTRGKRRAPPEDTRSTRPVLPR